MMQTYVGTDETGRPVLVRVDAEEQTVSIAIKMDGWFSWGPPQQLQLAD